MYDQDVAFGAYPVGFCLFCTRAIVSHDSYTTLDNTSSSDDSDSVLLVAHNSCIAKNKRERDLLVNLDLYTIASEANKL